MNFYEKALIVSIIVIWLSVVFKYETIAFLSRSRSSSGSGSSSSNSRSSGGSSNSESQHRVRQSISNTFHRISDKISDKIHHRDPKPKPVPEPPKPPPVIPSAPKPPPVVVVPSAPKPEEKPPPYVPPKNQGSGNVQKNDNPPSYDSLFNSKPKPGPGINQKQPEIFPNPKPPIVVVPSAPKPDEKPPPYVPPKNQGSGNVQKNDKPPSYDPLSNPKNNPNLPVQPQPFPQQPGSGINSKQPGAPPYPQQPYNSGQQPYPQQPGSNFNQWPSGYVPYPQQPGIAPYPQQPYNPGPQFYPQQPGIAPYPQQPYNPRPQTYPPPPLKPGVYGGSGSNSLQDKVKTGVGTLAMASLAKKIFSSGKHTGGQHNYRTGMYYNYNYRPDRYGTINGEVCTNNYNYDGIIYGQFICPIDGFSYDATLCCGPLYEQYCCTQAEYSALKSGNSYQPYTNNYQDSNVHTKKNRKWDGIMISIVVVVIVAVIIIVAGVMVLWYCKKRIYNRVPTSDQQTNQQN